MKYGGALRPAFFMPWFRFLTPRSTPAAPRFSRRGVFFVPVCKLSLSSSPCFFTNSLRHAFGVPPPSNREAFGSVFFSLPLRGRWQPEGLTEGVHFSNVPQHASSSSIFATIRFCSASGGRGINIFLHFSALNPARAPTAFVLIIRCPNGLHIYP